MPRKSGWKSIAILFYEWIDSHLWYLPHFMKVKFICNALGWLFFSKFHFWRSATSINVRCPSIKYNRSILYKLQGIQSTMRVIYVHIVWMYMCIIGEFAIGDGEGVGWTLYKYTYVAERMHIYCTYLPTYLPAYLSYVRIKRIMQFKRRAHRSNVLGGQKENR